jgi:hypothetical protein
MTSSLILSRYTGHPFATVAHEAGKAYNSFFLLLIAVLPLLPLPSFASFILIWATDLKTFWLGMVLILFGIHHIRIIRSLLPKTDCGQTHKTMPFQSPGRAGDPLKIPSQRPADRGNKAALFLVCLLIFLGFAYTHSHFKRQGPWSFKFLTGDEPQYLLITHSLVSDRDFDLFNNIFLREFIQFYNPEDMIGGHGQWGADQRWYSKHRLGLPLLISPAYYFGYRFFLGIRNTVTLWLCLLAALLAVEAYQAAWAITRSKGLSWMIILAVFLSVPLLMYPAKIFPELPAALFIFMAYRRMAFPLKDANSSPLFMGILIGSLPWFHERFIPVSVMLGLYFVLRERKNFKNLLVFSGPLILSIFLQILYYLAVNGAPYPLPATHRGYFNPEGFLNGLLGIWMDQSKGILPYSPIYLVSFWGFYYLWKESRAKTLFLLIILLSIYGISGGYRQWWGGLCPPGRYLVTLAPLLVVPLSYCLKKGPSPMVLFIFLSSLIWTAWGSWTSLAHPDLLYNYQTLFQNNFLFPLPDIFIPSFLPLKHSNLPQDYLKAIIWLFFMVLGGFLMVRNFNFLRARSTPLQGGIPVLAGLLLISAVLTLTYPRDLEEMVFNNPRSNKNAQVNFDRIKPVYFLEKGSFNLTGKVPITFQYIYPCADFAHGKVTILNDPEALNGKAAVWRGEISGDSPVVWGQYETLPKGTYEALFRLKAESAEYREIVTLDVAREGGKVVDRRHIPRKQWDQFGAYQELKIPFTLDRETAKMEFRIWVHPGATIWADRITVKPIPKKR